MGDVEAQRPHILVVEDNPGDVELLKLALEHAGLDCDLTVLEDGGQALEFVRGQEPSADKLELDLAVIDLNLPKNDGLEILEAMRINPKFAKLPVAVFSSSSLPRERAKMEALQVRHHVIKPSDLEEFLEIGNVLKGILQSNKPPKRQLEADPPDL